MGNKYKLLSQIIPLFPRNIGTFYDLFAGSGTMSLNVRANKYVMNDLSNHLYNLYDMFKKYNSDEIISYCEQNATKYGFSRDLTDKPKIAEHNREPYYKCREDMNNNPSTLGFYFLTFYSFCNQFRFNNGNYNMPVGNGYFKEESKYLIKNFSDFLHNDNVHIFCKSYDEFTDFEDNSFCYFDIPYSNTCAVYNNKGEINGWNEKSDLNFFKYCEKLNSIGIKWAVSNVFENKGKVNEHLIRWCEKNKWIVYHLDAKYAGHSYEFANSKTDEVLICNYAENRSSRLF